jgi:hypothetical protein
MAAKSRDSRIIHAHNNRRTIGGCVFYVITLKSEHQTLVQQYPKLDTQLKQLFKVLGDIEDMVGHTPATVGESVE